GHFRWCDNALLVRSGLSGNQPFDGLLVGARPGLVSPRKVSADRGEHPGVSALQELLPLWNRFSSRIPHSGRRGGLCGLGFLSALSRLLSAPRLTSQTHAVAWLTLWESHQSWHHSGGPRSPEPLYPSEDSTT